MASDDVLGTADDSGFAGGAEVVVTAAVGMAVAAGGTNGAVMASPRTERLTGTST